MCVFVKRAQNLLSFGFLFFCLGWISTTLLNQQYNPSHFTQLPVAKKTYLAKVEESAVETKNAVRLEVSLIQILDSTNQRVTGKTFLYTPKIKETLQLLPGDYFLFHAELKAASAPKNPHEFDYKNYLYLHQIYAQGYTNNIYVLDTHLNSANRFFSTLRIRLFGYIEAMQLSAEEESVAAALLLGYRHLLSDQTQQAFAGAGAMHVLAVSGLHVGILYIITAFILKLDKRKPYKNGYPKVLLTILIIWIYAATTGLSPSVSRAAIMFTFIASGHFFKRKPATYQAIIASAILLLVYNPNNLFQVGFQLSYTAVFGILYLQPKIYNSIPKPKMFIVDRIWQITAVSIAAQAATFPLSVYYFHQFPVLFFISNLLVIPLAWLLMNYGIFLLVFSLLITPPYWLVLPFQYLLKTMIVTVNTVEKWPFSVWHKLNVGRIEMFIILILVYSLATAIWQKKKIALFISMVSILIIVGIQTSDAIKHKQRKQITFYSIKNQVAIEYQNQKNGFIIGTKKLLNDKDAMLFHMLHNQWANGLKNPDIYYIHENINTQRLIANSGFIEFENQRILLVENATDSTKFALNPTHIIVAPRVKPFYSIPKNSIIILTSGHQEKNIAVWRNRFKEAIVLQETGAYVVDLLR